MKKREKKEMLQTLKSQVQKAVTKFTAASVVVTTQWRSKSNEKKKKKKNRHSIHVAV
jgi:hypothetical protein